MNNQLNTIIASAGTGKTETIVSKIESLIIEKHIDIMNIVLIAFTNKATKEMKERLRQKLLMQACDSNKLRDQIDKINMASICTIHSFCDDIIRDYGLRIGISPNYRIDSFSYETNLIIDKIVNENYNEKICSKIPTYTIKDMLKNFYKEMKDKGIKYELSYKLNKMDFWNEVRQYISDLYEKLDEEIEKEKKELNILTHNDLLCYAARLTSEEGIAKKIAEKVQYLFIDECQDINLYQMELIENLMKFINITIVGDEKQSVYGFRGSNKKAFIKLIEKFNNSGGNSLINDTNFRTNSTLIKIINDIFNSKFYFHNSLLSFKNIPLVAYKKDSEIDVFEITYGKNIVDIVKSVAQNIDFDYKACNNNIVVLCRTNREVSDVANNLKQQNIKAQVYLAKSIFRSKAIIDLCKVLRYLSRNDIIEKFEIFFTDYYLACIKFFTESHLDNVLDGLKYEIKNYPLTYIINRLFEATKICEYYSCIYKEQYNSNLNRIKEIIRDLSMQGLSNLQIIDHLNRMINTQQNEPESEVVFESPIIISTIHTFKGLAGDIVILYNADRNLYRVSNTQYEYEENDNLISFNKNAIVLNNYAVAEDENFEYIKHNNLIERLEEEIRLFYVACTRAKKKLIIMNYRSRDKLNYLIENNDDYVSYYRWLKESNLKLN